MEQQNNMFNGEQAAQPTGGQAAAAKPPVERKTATQTAVALKEMQDQTTNKVLNHVQELQASGDLILPDGYAVGNQLKLAWLNILEVKDKSNRPAIEVCTKESIANALLEMVLKGLSVMKKQGDFIVYGNRLTFTEEYHGTIALARRLGGVVGVPTGNVIYEGDTFLYEISTETGRKRVVKHDQDFKNIDANKIVGAYATMQLQDGSTYVEIMNINQIRQAWNQGATKGQSPAHKNFPDQMAIKTVIGRACKLFITTSDDAGLYSSSEFDEKRATGKEEAPPALPDTRPTIDIEDVESEPVLEPEKPKQPAEKKKAQPAVEPEPVTTPTF